MDTAPQEKRNPRIKFSPGLDLRRREIEPVESTEELWADVESLFSLLIGGVMYAMNSSINKVVLLLTWWMRRRRRRERNRLFHDV